MLVTDGYRTGYRTVTELMVWLQRLQNFPESILENYYQDNLQNVYIGKFPKSSVTICNFYNLCNHHTKHRELFI